MLEAFNKPQGIAVDTHAKRISNLIGLSNESDPVKIEQDLIKIFPKEYLRDKVYNQMVERSKLSNIEVIKYVKNS